MKNIFQKFIFLLVIGLGQTSCSKEASNSPEPPAFVEKGDLFEVMATLPIVSTDAIIQAKNFIPNVSNLVRFPVKIYTVTYKSKALSGEEIIASGAICVPESAGPFPLLSYQPDTYYGDVNAPSNFAENQSNSKLWTALLFASAGYIVSVPDYLGFGSTSQELHPYHHASSLATHSLDMLLASKEFLQGNELPFENKLFLTGYSEGGYATMALQQKIESDPGIQLQIEASSAGGGAYDLMGTGRTAFRQENYSITGFLAFIVHAYNETYDLEIDLNTIFNPPYPSLIENGIFDGSQTVIEVEAQFTTNIKELFTASFLEEVTDEDNTLTLEQRILENNLLDWMPRSKTRLYHGIQDDIVPFSSAEKALENFNTNGSTNVELISLENLSHSEAYIPFITETIKWFQDF